MGSRDNPTSAQDTRKWIVTIGPVASALLFSTEPVTSDSLETQSTPQRIRTFNPGNPGNSIKWLATQIPEFGGGEDENVTAWIRRVEKVAEIHGASDGVTLLAASSRLVRATRCWYEIQTSHRSMAKSPY